MAMTSAGEAAEECPGRPRGSRRMMIARGWLLALTACGAAAGTSQPPARDEPPAGAPARDEAPAAEPAAAAVPARSARTVDDSLTGVIDRPAPPWQVSQWFNSPPLALEQLRGKVVFVRWFMGPSCP